MSAQAFCTVTASTKRNASLSGGRLGAATTHLASLLITPLWPAGNETVRTLDLNSPREFKECYHVPVTADPLPDVKEGDILTVSGTDYPVYFAGEWTDGDIPTLHLVVQEVKRG